MTHTTIVNHCFQLGSIYSSHFNDCVRNFTRKKLFIDLNEFIY